MDSPNVAPTPSSAAPFSTPVPAVVSKSGHPFQQVEPLSVAASTSQTPMSFAESIQTSYQPSNAEAVQGATYSFGQQGMLASQAPMTPKGSTPSFEKLDIKAISTNSGPMCTDYKS